jgi:hypothetical protein
MRLNAQCGVHTSLGSSSGVLLGSECLVEHNAQDFDLRLRAYFFPQNHQRGVRPLCRCPDEVDERSLVRFEGGAARASPVFCPRHYRPLQ